MPTRRPQLVLFDVDGTLITTGGRAGGALCRALEDIFGMELSIEGYRYSGKTDPQIVYELMALRGVPRAEVEPRIDEVFSRYLERLRVALVPGSARVLPGVRELLAELGERPWVRVGLLTGNVEPGARVKLEVAGLDGLFAVGAFGSDNEDRNRLVPIGRARAEATWGERYPGEQTVIVGDAEPDVACARAGGARVVAVASGWTDLDILAGCSPDALLPSLDDPAALPAVLGANEADSN